jgi:23S rRNA (guanosine2251-2'-O)-methyltransferase
MSTQPHTEAVYGMHAVRALLLRHPQRVRRVLLQRGRQDARAQEIERLARAADCPLERIEGERLSQRLGDVVHQGVAAEVLTLLPWDEDALLAAVTAAVAVTGTAAPAEPLLLALDGVQDPHNLGACLRTADACGVLAVIVPRDRAAPLNATARKAAAGAAESTPVAVVTNLARTLRLLKDTGLWIVGAEAEASQRAQDVELSGPRVLVVGAEGSGLRQLTRRHCDWLVRLPSAGAVESLNVSVAAGMLLYEAVRQRTAGVA